MAQIVKTKKKVTTAKLLSWIFRTKNIDSFLEKNKEHLALPTLAEHLEELCRKKKMTPRDVVINADIDRNYGGKIFRGQRIRIHRDYIIRLAFGLKLDYKECQKLLDVARECRLHPRVPRDLVIISCLRDKLSYLQTEEKLYTMNMSVLGEKRVR